jgi:hypothetical protein
LSIFVSLGKRCKNCRGKLPLGFKAERQRGIRRMDQQFAFPRNENPAEAGFS